LHQLTLNLLNINKYLFIQNVHNVAQRKPREGGGLFRQEGNVKNYLR